LTFDLAVHALISHPMIAAVTFVGTTAVAKDISSKCNAFNKRILALGGAKNHLVAAADCDISMTSSDVVNSFTGNCFII
jgi:malonate-semialdehyde dehydrogenase (acetylating)/methylmalonate-semialdehyde dehydrogenase